ncbi:MAG TPA: hypothetical protein VJQ45_02845 [Ktedonobacterales bacterium]|nr:hypothetical protein [Ktedonobacterales bacterium]
MWVGACCAALFGLALAFVLAACGATSAKLPQQSGGTFTSDAYHVRVTYPDGWKLTTLPGGSAAIPLSVTITHVGGAQSEGGAFVSTFTLTVIDVASPDEATPIAQLKKQIATPASSLTPITLSGQQAYQSAPQQQKSPNNALSVTHTDYYLLTARYEYAISTDAVSSDNGADSALQAMVQSFTLLP